MDGSQDTNAKGPEGAGMGPFAALEWLESRSDGGKAVAGGVLVGASGLAFAGTTALGWPLPAAMAAAFASIGLVILALLGGALRLVVGSGAGEGPLGLRRAAGSRRTGRRCRRGAGSHAGKDPSTRGRERAP